MIVYRTSCQLILFGIVVALFTTVTLGYPVLTFAGEVSFSRDVRPILAEYCLQCHGPDEAHREAGLRLDVPDSTHELAIVAGKPDESEVIQRITTTDADLKMPPPETEKRLTDKELNILQEWIAAGATFEGHWSYQPVQRPAIPQPKGDASTEIDQFILADLESKGLTLTPKATRRQLIRRASFDLIGLPPTPEEVKAFVSDASDDDEAFAKVIDRLLDSPRYGERWGRHWLDIARYADTYGGSAIGYKRFPFSYTYRDYVIRAINEDLPYNTFVMQQLAADQLGLDENDTALAALGFLTVGLQFRSVHDRIDDQIDVVSRGLMGMTVACARCHDHKFDEIPTTDYYALYSTLASSEQPDELPVLGHPEPSDQLQDYQEKLNHRKANYRDMARDQAEVMRSRIRSQVGMYLKELAKGTPEQDVSAAFLSYRTDDIRPVVLNRWRDYMKEMKEDDPVFGPWVRLGKVESSQFVTARDELVQLLKKENGDPAKFAEMHRLGTEAPKWNPRVLDAIENTKPKSQIELAETYDGLFTKVHHEWLKALLEASLEAATGGKLITDEDKAHTEINSAINQQLRFHLYDSESPTAVPDDLAVKMLNRTVSDNLSGKRGTIHNLNLNAPGSPPRGMILTESMTPSTFRVFLRGNPLSRGEEVTPRFLSAVPPHDTKPFRVGQRRLGLARAIVASENPLTRRVVVNWIWRNHFGLGLVRTPDDFGTRGTPPTHPQLLDYLASVFADDGWSIKKMHRRIMLSDVYQQGSIENVQAREIDPENRLLWRMPRKRLEMEAMRDAMLAVSGELDCSKLGGRPFDFETNPIVPRRSVYGFINRDIISNLASTFDGADPTSCTVKRPDTIVPQQTLYVLNSEFIQNRADALAKTLKNKTDDDRERVVWLYRMLYSRIPDERELNRAVTFVNFSIAENTDKDSAGEEATITTQVDRWAQLAHAMLASNEFTFID